MRLGERGLLRGILTVMLILLLTNISGPIPFTSLFCAQELKGDWIVTGVEVVENEMIALSGNLTVKSSGSLALRNVTLALNVEENGQYGISVEPGGSLFIYNSNISSSTAFRFFFSVVEGKFVMKNSELRDAGWGEEFGWAEDVKKRGLYIQSDNALIDNNFISDSHSVTLHDSRNSSVINNILMKNDYHGINADHSQHNFVFNNSIYDPSIGIGIGGCDNVIANNIIFNPKTLGIGACESWNNTITNNRIIAERYDPCSGIQLWNGCGNFTITNNTIQNFLKMVYGGGVMDGIEVVRSVNNRIEGNSLEGVQNGVILSYSHNNVVVNNIISNISQGVAGTYHAFIPSLDAIQLYHSSNNVVINNRIYSVQSNAIILLDDASNNVLQANLINSSYYGISLHYSSDNNTIVNNAMSQIRSRAMILDESNGNIVHHNNFLDPDVDAYDNGLNHWSLGGEGNYWGDYEGQDVEGDSIGDVPRLIPPNGSDNFPLMNPRPVVFVRTPYVEPEEGPMRLGGDYLITADETWENKRITVRNGLEVRKGATLTLKNVTLMVWGWWGIFVEGSIHIYNSTITAADPKYGGYPLWVANAHEFVMKNSKLHYAGFSFQTDFPSGLAIWGEPYTYGTNVTIENSIFTHNYRGVWLTPGGESYISIVNNTISYSYDGIVGGVDIVNNTISKIINAGVFSFGNPRIQNNNISHIWRAAIITNKVGPDLTVKGNTISNSEVGILLFCKEEKHAIGVTVVNNLISDAWRWAIQISQEYPSANVVRNNTISSCAGGIYLAQGSRDNLIYENNITNNENGIWLHLSSKNTLYGNNIAANGVGIELWNSSHNSIYHNNFIKNTLQVYTENSLNAWDNSYPSGGNYWSDYTTVDLHHGPYQDEAGGDGIGDKPYSTDENNVDRYPLMVPTYTSLLWFRLTTTSTEGGTTRPPSGTYAYVKGTTVSITAMPDINHELAYWNLDGENVGSANPIGVIMVADHMLHAVFRPIMYNLTISATTGGTTDPGSGTYTNINGTIVSVTAMPDTIHEFSYWLLDGERRTENPIVVTICADHTLEAVFQFARAVCIILILIPFIALVTLAIVLAKRKYQGKRRNLTSSL